MVICLLANSSKHEQMWHLSYICYIIAVRENPFFRPVVLKKEERTKGALETSAGVPLMAMKGNLMWKSVLF